MLHQNSFFLTLSIFLTFTFIMPQTAVGLQSWNTSNGLAQDTDPFFYEKSQGTVVGDALHTLLDASSTDDPIENRINYSKGGAKDIGYGVQEFAVVDGNHAIGDEGNQGYFVDEVDPRYYPDYFKETGKTMSGKEFYVYSTEKLRFQVARQNAKFKNYDQTENRTKQIRYIVKTGIGGQHTPFQGIAAVLDDLNTGKKHPIYLTGEYELGKNYFESIQRYLDAIDARWDEVLLVPSSKSGSTDETMKVFEEFLFYFLQEQAKEVANRNQADDPYTVGAQFANRVFDVLNTLNIDSAGKERKASLFEGFGIDRVYEKTKDLFPNREDVVEIFETVFGNMYFESTDNPEQSRLSAFVRRSDLENDLGDEDEMKSSLPLFGSMFDNVGGRWTADLHAIIGHVINNVNDAGKLKEAVEEYWNFRYEGIKQVRNKTHLGAKLADYVLDNEKTTIGFVVPDEFFWFGKAIEQNFNESIWQFTNYKNYPTIHAIKVSEWEFQKQNYENNIDRVIFNMTDLVIEGVDEKKISLKNLSDDPHQNKMLQLADLFTTFYGMTYTAGNRLIARVLHEKGYKAEDVDISDLDNEATKILQKNLYLRQPMVELGKGFLEAKLTSEEMDTPEKKADAYKRLYEKARDGKLKRTNIKELQEIMASANVNDVQSLADAIVAAIKVAKLKNKKFVPFIYLHGSRFHSLRTLLAKSGYEWILQGTADQHISYQQVLATPDRFLPFFVSFLPTVVDTKLKSPARKSIGFAKSYLNMASPYLIRHLFAEASYEAMLDVGGEGVFLGLGYIRSKYDALGAAFQQAANSDEIKNQFGFYQYYKNKPVKALILDKLVSKDALLKLERDYRNVMKLIDRGEKRTREELEALLEDVKPQVVIIRSDTKEFQDPEFVKKAKKLGVEEIIRAGAGTDNIDSAATTEAGISEVRTHGNANSVVNMAFRLFLAAMNKASDNPTDNQLDLATDVFKDNEWNEVFNIPVDEYVDAHKKNKSKRGETPEYQRAQVFRTFSPAQAIEIFKQLEGKTVGIVGFGETGAINAARLDYIRKTFGINFEIAAFSPSLYRGKEERVAIAEQYGVNRLSEEELLEKSDVLFFQLDGGQKGLYSQEKMNKIKAKVIVSTTREGVFNYEGQRDFLSRGDTFYVADDDLAKKGQPVESIQQLIEDFPHQVIYTNHVSASTKDAGLGVANATASTLKGILLAKLGLATEAETAEVVQIRNNAPVTLLPQVAAQRSA